MNFIDRFAMEVSSSNKEPKELWIRAIRDEDLQSQVAKIPEISTYNFDTQNLNTFVVTSNDRPDAVWKFDVSTGKFCPEGVLNETVLLEADGST